MVQIIKTLIICTFALVVIVLGMLFYATDKTLDLAMTTATAVSKIEKVVESGEEAEELPPMKEPVSVKTSRTFKAGQVKNFELSTFYSMKVQFVKTDGEQVIVSLIGQGTQYKNSGREFTDWFQVEQRGSKLKIKSPDKNDFGGFEKLKKLAKNLKSDDVNGDKLTMMIEFPEKHRFQKLEVAGVSNRVDMQEVSFDVFELASVSGTLVMKESAGRKIEIQSVSGSNEIEISDLKIAEFDSVSGSTKLVSKNTTPELEFNSISGNLKLTLPKESEVEVAFQSMTGELINEFGSSSEASNKIEFSSLSGGAEIFKIH